MPGGDAVTLPRGLFFPGSLVMGSLLPGWMACGQVQHIPPVTDAQYSKRKTSKQNSVGANGTTGCYQNKRKPCPHTTFSVAKQSQDPPFLNKLKKMNPDSAFSSAFEGDFRTSANTEQWCCQSTEELPVCSFLSLTHQYPLSACWDGTSNAMVHHSLPHLCPATRPCFAASSSGRFLSENCFHF